MANMAQRNSTTPFNRLRHSGHTAETTHSISLIVLIQIVLIQVSHRQGRMI